MNNKEVLLFPEQQKYFTQRGEAFVIGEDITKKYPDQIGFLTNQGLWKNCLRKHRGGLGLALLLDADKQTGFVFNPNNQQIENIFSIQQESLPETIAGAIVVCPRSPNSLESISANLESILLFLSEDAPVFAFEDFPEKNNIDKSQITQEAQARKEALLDLGLAEAKILTRPTLQKGEKINSFLVWRSRMPKNWRPRKPINLLDEGPLWRRSLVENSLIGATRQYERAGLTVLNDDEIREALRKTTFPLNTIGQAKMAFGFQVEARCGCCWSIDLKGVQTRTYQCERDCQS